MPELPGICKGGLVWPRGTSRGPIDPVEVASQKAPKYLSEGDSAMRQASVVTSRLITSLASG
jgi:hypothetical protein